jgi:energy-coupling factor transporter ATP-binding protein EcfA2
LDRVGDHFADFSAVDEDTLAVVGFDQLVRDWEISRLSTGEKQRLAIVRLLDNQPQCLLLDEPTASLDQDLTARVEQLLLTYGETHGAPILWVSHDPAQLVRVSPRCFFMASDGVLINAGGAE